MEEKSSKRERLKIIVLLLIGFIIGFATHAFTSVNEVTEDEIVETSLEKTVGTSTEPISSEVEKETTTGIPVDATANSGSADGYSLSVIDQSAGNVVHVSQVVLEQESWVAIREDNNGGLGNILGAYRYSTGTHTGSVELLRGTESDVMYYAVVYIDDGDKIFDHKKDTLLTDEGGKIFATKFRTY
ncbi:MAG: hypothetical protein KAS07_02770 [Candidatus Pacebacteria bacterium]|nr:hypothetical protein [Candidatus Paceibacterota bacterium]